MGKAAKPEGVERGGRADRRSPGAQNRKCLGRRDLRSFSFRLAMPARGRARSASSTAANGKAAAPSPPRSKARVERSAVGHEQSSATRASASDNKGAQCLVKAVLGQDMKIHEE